MAQEQALSQGPSGGGITLIVLRDEKIGEIMNGARDLLEVQHRHTLELAKAGIRPAAKESNGCCNCVLC